MAQSEDSKITPEFRAQMIAWQNEQWAAAITGNNPIEYVEPHPTLRDQFAMAALTGIVIGEFQCPSTPATHESVAHDCYEMADAMLEARKK